MTHSQCSLTIALFHKGFNSAIYSSLFLALAACQFLVFVSFRPTLPLLSLLPSLSPPSLPLAGLHVPLVLKVLSHKQNVHIPPKGFD
uniref:Uncharacterized protein n=1 Tax=Anguilla anguilla TaxID=7936 RepID=A0A0E9VE91_ANGAN